MSAAIPIPDHAATNVDATIAANNDDFPLNISFGSFGWCSPPKCDRFALGCRIAQSISAVFFQAHRRGAETLGCPKMLTPGCMNAMWQERSGLCPRVIPSPAGGHLGATGNLGDKKLPVENKRLSRGLERRNCLFRHFRELAIAPVA
jgi:hypothetical protein